MLRRLAVAILFVVAVVLAPRTSWAWQIRIHEWTEIEDRAAGSTHVVVARFVRWEREQANDRPPFSVAKMYGEGALARVHVDQVIAGANDVQGRDIVVVGTYAESADRGAVLFLRRDGDRFAIVDNSLFKTTGNDVELATAPGRLTLPLAELRTRLRKVTPIRVTWTARVAERANRGGTLAVVYVAKNEGSAAASVLPPSYCASVKAYPLESDGLWHAEQDKWFEQPNAWFAAKKEEPMTVGPGSEHSFTYEIPLASLKMDRPGRWDVVLGMTESFCHAPAGTRALPNYMADRVARVAVGDVEPEPAPAMSAPPVPVPPVDVARPTAPPRGGCASCTASPIEAAARAIAFFAGVLVVFVAVVVRRRGRPRP